MESFLDSFRFVDESNGTSLTLVRLEVETGFFRGLTPMIGEHLMIVGAKLRLLVFLADRVVRLVRFIRVNFISCCRSLGNKFYLTSITLPDTFRKPTILATNNFMNCIIFDLINFSSRLFLKILLTQTYLI